MEINHPSSPPKVVGCSASAADDHGGERRTVPSRIAHELGQSMFHLLEPEGRSIDVGRSFAPGPNAPMVVAKVSFFAWTLATVLIDDFVYLDHAYFSLAYFTHWGLIFSLFYQALSIFVLIRRSRSSDHSETNNKNLDGNKEQLVDWPIRSMWCLFSISSTVEVTISIGFWPMYIAGVVHQPITYNNVMTHGGVAVLVLIDGLCLNMIPLRSRQIVFPTTVGAIYALWTVMHWKLGIGNPEEESYNSIYPNLDYENDTVFSFIQSAVFTLVVIPVAFLIVRMLSLWSGGFKFDGGRRRTVVMGRRGTEETLDDTWDEALEYPLEGLDDIIISDEEECDVDSPSSGK